MTAAMCDNMLKSLIFIDICACADINVCVCVCVYMPMYLCTSKLKYQLQQREGCSLYELPLDAATPPCKIEYSDLRITEICFGICMTAEFLQEH